MPRPSSSRAQQGGTLFGLIAGLVVGLVVAVAVALYVSKAPVPFVSREARPPATPPVDPANAPDPNRSLYGKDAPAGAPAESGPSATEPAPAPVPDASRRDPLGDFLASQGQGGQKRGQAPAPADNGGNYFLQVGAYRVIEDAEALNAKLAFMGFEAHLEQADTNGGTINRVRLGPFARLDDMNRTRARLAENGIEAAVIKK